MKRPTLQSVERTLTPFAYMTSGAVLIAVMAFAIWATINADVLWKAVRFPEAVRQMEVEVSVK